MSLTGHVRARDQGSLAFRIDGRVIERPIKVGDVVSAGQVVVRLDPQNQENMLRSAQANLSAAEAVRRRRAKTSGDSSSSCETAGRPARGSTMPNRHCRPAEAQVTSRAGTTAHRAGSARLYVLRADGGRRDHRGRR